MHMGRRPRHGVAAAWAPPVLVLEGQLRGRRACLVQCQLWGLSPNMEAKASSASVPSGLGTSAALHWDVRRVLPAQ